MQSHIKPKLEEQMACVGGFFWGGGRKDLFGKGEGEPHDQHSRSRSYYKRDSDCLRNSLKRGLGTNALVEKRGTFKLCCECIFWKDGPLEKLLKKR